jgi:transcriptional regulator with XRE-family HTH domain
MENHKQIADNIKKFRELKNVTRDQMAADLEMSLSGYGKLERGEVDITINKLYKISDILEVSVSQMMNFDVSNIFNVHGNQTVNGVEVKEQHYYSDQYKDKYIKMLEEELERLKNTTSKKVSK